ncbi:Disrupted In Schizophrenia 1 Protein [Manis pentadactyla]|nr:Disrupted In Schizophrenia 1 Protein [Manis pentadactyla]
MPALRILKLEKPGLGKVQHLTYKASVKESTVNYTHVLEDKLHSCKCPLLGKVWEADLEACQLLIQTL